MMEVLIMMVILKENGIMYTSVTKTNKLMHSFSMVLNGNTSNCLQTMKP